MPELGSKHDNNKLRYDLVPPGPLAHLAQVYTDGAKKYDAWNWAKGIQYSRLYAALMRHLQLWWAGEAYDSEDGQHHLASVAWVAFALLQYELDLRTDLDDRPHTRGLETLYAVKDAMGMLTPKAQGGEGTPITTGGAGSEA